MMAGALLGLAGDTAIEFSQGLSLEAGGAIKLGAGGRPVPPSRQRQKTSVGSLRWG